MFLILHDATTLIHSDPRKPSRYPVIFMLTVSNDMVIFAKNVGEHALYIEMLATKDAGVACCAIIYPTRPSMMNNH